MSTKKKKFVFTASTSLKHNEAEKAIYKSYIYIRNPIYIYIRERNSEIKNKKEKVIYNEIRTPEKKKRKIVEKTQKCVAQYKQPQVVKNSLGEINTK